MFADSQASNYEDIDEIARYKLLEIARFEFDKAEVISDRSSFLQFGSQTRIHSRIIISRPRSIHESSIVLF